MATEPNLRHRRHERDDHPGGWIGIDLGTSNCTAAVWDISRSRCKVLRFPRLGAVDDDDNVVVDERRRDIARANVKGGKMVPSAILFYRTGDSHPIVEEHFEGVGTLVGQPALRSFFCAENSNSNSNSNSNCSDDDDDDDDDGNNSSALVSSVKRIVGMSSRQAREMRELEPEFWNSLPFSAVILNDRPVNHGSGDGHDENDLDENDFDLEDVMTEGHDGKMREKNHGIAMQHSIICDVLGDANGSNSNNINNCSSSSSSSSENINNNHANNNNSNIHATKSLAESTSSHNDLPRSQEGVAIRVTPLPYDPLASSRDTHPVEFDDKQKHITLLVTPLRATSILLNSLRIAAEDYLLAPSNVRKHGIRVPGLEPASNATTTATATSTTASSSIRNAVIGVPAQYTQSQRNAICIAAKEAGFAGYVGVVTESTAAAMAYGLFVSPKVVTAPLPPLSGDYDGTVADGDGHGLANGKENENFESDDENVVAAGKRVLVFDMGGGTTDVTIAVMDGHSTGDDSTDSVRFRVVATAGDSRLGGDDVDELLARYVWKRLIVDAASLSEDDGKRWNEEWKASNHRELIRRCRRAKEELCGNGEDDYGEADGSGMGMASTQITLKERRVVITRDEFDTAIQPLIERAERVIDEALSSLRQTLYRHPSGERLPHDRKNLSRNQTHQPSIHEVVLVGGSTRIPTLRSMLRRKFPPPIPPDLCTSISAETAVAQGLAIQAALISGAVPLWELRNAMMLDVLPHSIGVWVIHHAGSNNDGGASGYAKGAPFSKGDILEPDTNPKHEGHYVPILVKDAPLPAVGNATFTLADIDQPGVTIVAVEKIGPGEVYQCMEVFHFLLYRLDDETRKSLDARNVEVGMTLETSGKFVVSIFDENDPEHRERRRRYLKEKALAGRTPESDDDQLEEFYKSEEQNVRASCSGTEIGLVLVCAILFALYVGARIAFSDLDMPLENDEL
ncbi:hypothetical protein ACHAXS_014294 [Conticribra weissflogii]